MNSIVWKRVKSLVNKEAVEELEKKYGFDLPSELKQVIKEYNGGRPVPKTLVTEKGDEYEVKGLLSYNEKDTENIYKVIDYFVEHYDQLIPFAQESSGNYYCCCKSGEIIYWTQEEEIYQIANSFSEFIGLLSGNN